MTRNRGQPASAESIRKQTIVFMKDLGTYKKEYAHSVTMYADIVHQYRVVKQEFKNTGSKQFVENRDGNMVRNPLLRDLDKLYSQFIKYSDILMLNPKSFKDLDGPKTTTSKLEELLLNE